MMLTDNLKNRGEIDKHRDAFKMSVQNIPEII